MTETYPNDTFVSCARCATVDGMAPPSTTHEPETLMSANGLARPLEHRPENNLEVGRRGQITGADRPVAKVRPVAGR